MARLEPARSLALRLREYRDNLLAIADQLENVADSIAAVRPNVTPEELKPLEDGASLYRQIAADLSHILTGDELGRFTVTGVVQPEDDGQTPA
jgi:hypothetical protein